MSEITHLARRGIERARNALHNQAFRLRHGDGVDVMAEDWDTLILLDACRYDYFEEAVDYDDRLERRLSRGWNSASFIAANFQARDLYDTVYVTANPHVIHLEDGVFHDVVSVADDGWDPDLETVPPGVVSAAARDAAARYPHKRLVVHYMQPHEPYIGPTGREIADRLGGGGWDPDSQRTGEQQEDIRPLTAVQEREEIRPGMIRRAYREDLRIALDECRRLLADIGGRTVISADHGELLGERVYPFAAPAWGHGAARRVPELCEVPWLVVDGDRRQVVAEDPVGEARLADDVAADRLEQLGYLEAKS